MPLTIHHSGGVANSNPLLDLGGVMSNFAIADGFDTLFESVGAEPFGLTDYRCFYVYNGTLQTYRNVMAWATGSQNVMIGVDFRNEIQTVTFHGNPNEGEHATLSIDGSPFDVYFDPNPTTWAVNFQTGIRSVEGLGQTRVSVSGNVPLVIFTVKFDFEGSGKKFPLMTSIFSNLTGTTIDFAEVADGSPINTTAPTISTVLNAPPVNFQDYGPGGPITIGNLDPGDSFPVWAKRRIPAGTQQSSSQTMTFVTKSSV
jgi:hypothetical protein